MAANYTQHKQLTHLKSAGRKNSVRYSLAFVSLISPGNMVNVRLALLSVSSSKKKLLLKQSYLLLTWAYYLSHTVADSFKRPSIVIKPIKQSKFTSLKAPMAHKTFSQEQYWLRFYRLQINFRISKFDRPTINSISGSVYTLLLLRSSLPLIETNLMLLKCFSFSIPASDSNFFTLKIRRRSRTN